MKKLINVMWSSIKL